MIRGSHIGLAILGAMEPARRHRMIPGRWSRGGGHGPAEVGVIVTTLQQEGGRRSFRSASLDGTPSSW